MQGFTFFRTYMVVLLSACMCACGPADSETPYDIDPSKEIATGISMIYSDSAIVKFEITSPLLSKYNDKGIMVEEFPKGLRIDFYDSDQRVNSWIYAKYALRRAAEGYMLLKDSVVLQTQNNDRLETSSLTWKEMDKTLSSQKFIRMIQGSTQDTLFGTGFKANIDFSNFEISNFIGRRKYRDLSEEFDGNN